MLEDKVLEKLDRLSLAMREYARGGAGGVRRSRMLGSSAEFSDFREYAPGDDIRRIDWNAFARFEKLFLKLFMEEQEMCLTLLIDASRSMAAKWAFAKELAQALAYLALRGGDKVRIFVLSDDTSAKSRLFGGRGSFPELCAFLDGREPSGEAALDRLVPGLELASRGMSAVITDLLFEGEGERALKSLAFKRQQTALVHVLTKEELAPELSGALRLVDSETGEGVDLHMDRATLEEYGRSLEAFLKRVQARANRLGAAYALLRTDRALLEALVGGLYASGIIRG